MNALIDSSAFHREIGGWAVRGVCCALLSAFWAVMAGFQHPAEIAGMVFGVAVWVTLFATGCVWLPLPAAFSQPQAVRALKRAAWIKFLLTAVGGLCTFVASSYSDAFRALTLFWMVDMFLGMAALWTVNQLGGFQEIDCVARLDSFGWTALTTVIEGALMAVLIGGIALAVLGWWKLRSFRVLRRNLSPATSNG